ncbi:MAG: aminopeptidase P family protein [Deltaproteobacteria bacterium]|nr:aminopeptidase P family protein [Deltaproteobacteria bacterium]
MQPDVKMSIQNKMAFVRAYLLDSGMDAFLFLDMKNIRYLTGFKGSDGALLVGTTDTVLLVDGRYITQAKRESQGAAIYEYRDKMTGLMAVMKDKNVKAVGFEPASMTVDTYLKMQDKLDGISLQPIADQFYSLRAVKSEEEIRFMKKAIDISADALKDIEGLLKPGASEMDIALELEYKMRARGAEQVSFPTIAASGPNSALPHASPGNRRLQDGDVLVIDYGAAYGGYRSDETWTCVIGHADKKQKDVYALVKDAHDRALDKLRSGLLCKDIDLIARTCIEKGGFGDFFPHSTGHGIGLDVHESPRIAAQSEAVLKAGMVVTIEPGIYIPDLWGMRIEDMALIRDDGCDVLTRTSKNFRVLD